MPVISHVKAEIIPDHRFSSLSNSYSKAKKQATNIGMRTSISAGKAIQDQTLLILQ